MQRESNIELLRIISMWFILLHHLIVHALYPDVMTGHDGVTSKYAIYSLLEGFFYVAVDVFILISGYFGIKMRARRVWSLYLQCAFYGLLTYIFGVAIGIAPLVPHTFITKSVLIFSHLSSWWFVVCYLMLMVVAPFLNYGMQLMNKREYLWVLACLTFVQLYLGWFWQKAAYDISGYSFINFVYVYLIGGYLHRYVSDNMPIAQRRTAMLLYFGCAILFGICNIVRVYFKIPFGNLWAYNNPIMIIGAVGLVLFILTYKFHSNIVNRIGGGVFAAYLITDISYVGDFLYPFFGESTQTISSLILTVLVTFITAAVMLLTACGIDICRAWLMKPIICVFDWIDEKIEKSE